MKRTTTIVVVVVPAVLLALLVAPGARGPGTAAAAAARTSYQGSTFEEVWDQVASDPYDELPRYRVTLGSFFGFLTDHLLAASRRTLADKRDLLPYFRKLLHPNGICLAGLWEITEDNPYTGYFRPGSTALVIARASVALSETRRGELRAFGFAAKLFPTLDGDERVATANFFTIENLGGTLRDFFVDAENTNDIVVINPTTVLVQYSGVAATALTDFAIADETLDPTQPTIRQVYPVSELGEPYAEAVYTPKWIMITGDPEVERVTADDFRDELRVSRYPGGLRFQILVANEGSRLGSKEWQRIGHIDFYEDAVSESCDHRLHFTHPPYRQ